MKQEDTKQKILDKALELFSTQGYDSVSVGEIAKAVGIKAPSLYNHFPGKQAIFDAIVESTAAQYEADTDKIDIHVQNAKQDIPVFTEITADALFEKVRQIFEYSLHNETISRFRRMMTIEQFRSPELAALYSRRYVERILRYHAGIFRALIASGEICAEDPDALAMMYVSPVLTLIGICDRQPEREPECLEKLQNHVQLFFRMVHGSSASSTRRIIK
ncbi:MAG TPA: TetR/AcrR family transcriptional regulator [Oscillibacter sp.]|nr:TetR/AcrR family transcriptional regulator [Oscillibacter sp.]